MAVKMITKMEDKKKYPFRKPILNDYNQSLEKQWVVTYYVWNVDREFLQRKRAIISDKTIEQRIKSAEAIIKEINSWLKKGAYAVDKIEEIPETQPEELEDDISIIELAIQTFLNQIKTTRKANTYDTYNVQLKRFCSFLSTKPQLKKVGQVNQAIAHNFLDWMIKKELSNKSITTTKGTLFTFFEFVRKRKIIKENPFIEVESLPVVQGTRVAFSDKDAQTIKEYLTVTNPDPQFWLYISFLYYSFIRPDSELRTLKIGDIQKNYIRVRSTDAKNNKTQFVQISRGLEKIIEEYKLREYNSEWYIFTNKGCPGEIHPGEKWFYEKHTKMLNILNLNNKNYSQYSWKDTGVIALYRNTKDIKLIQRMCRHSSLEQTDKYLKSLGQFLEDEILDSFPVL